MTKPLIFSAYIQISNQRYRKVSTASRDVELLAHNTWNNYHAVATCASVYTHIFVRCVYVCFFGESAEQCADCDMLRMARNSL
jgi:hypothetical protein